MSQILYFGCESPDHKGHFLYTPRFSSPQIPYAKQTRLTRMLDGAFLELHAVPDAQGQGVWFPIADYLILTWWDRTGDSRGASNSAIIMTPWEKVGWDEFVERAQAAFPTIFARQTRRIVDNRLPEHRFIDPPRPA